MAHPAGGSVIKRFLKIVSLIVLVIVLIVGASVVWIEMSSRDAATRAKSFCDMVQAGESSTALAGRIAQTKVDLVIIESLEEKVTDGSKKASQMKKLVSEVKSAYISFRFYSNSPETFDCRVKVIDGKVESAEKQP